MSDIWDSCNKSRRLSGLSTARPILFAMSSSEEKNFGDSTTSEYAVEAEEEEREFPRANNSAKSADESSSSVDYDGLH